MALKIAFKLLNSQHRLPARVFLLPLALAGFVLACTPSFNWREISFEGYPITALLPCKPDRGTRSVPLAGSPRDMQMAGCEAGGATFTIAVIDVQDSQKVAAATTQLQAASKATQSRYMQHGSVIVQAAVYGQPQAGRDGPGALSSQALETFFSGLQLPGKP